MRALLQRVSRAAVEVDGTRVGEVGAGLLVLAGVRKGDTADDAAWIARKIAGLRIFAGPGGGMDRPVIEVGGAVLLVSQFTLYGDARKGRRPSFERAAPPSEAVPILEELRLGLEQAGLEVRTGRFGAHMAVELVNDGPVTLLLDSEDRKRSSPRPRPAGARQKLAAGGTLPGPLILASASPRRTALLAELGLPHRVEPTDVDETRDVPEDPAERVRVLAERKARAAAAVREDGIVLAADTLVARGGRVYGKPAGKEDAVRMLTELSGREHRVLTGVCAGDAASRRFLTRVVETHVTFHALDPAEIRLYADTGEALDKAGAYAIQGRGALLVAGIDGDYTNVVGLPVGPTLDLLEKVAGGAGAEEHGR